MAESPKGNIFHIKGRRVGADAIVSRDEQWGARAREANPPSKEWVYSSFPFYASESVVASGGMQTTFNVSIMPPVSSVIHATAARIKIYTEDSGKNLRVCLYRYVRERESTKKKRRLIKVLNSETVFDCGTQHRTAPLDVLLGGDGAKVIPGEVYFLGYRASSNSIVLPCASTNSMNHFPMYYQSYEDDVALPVELDLESMSKTYDGNVPWVSFLSKEASILL